MRASVICAVTLISMISRTAVAEELPPGITLLKPPSNYQEIIDEYLEGHLRDPYSAVKRVTRAPRFGTLRKDAYTTWTGWAVCMSINAKNAYGGFTGSKPYVFVISADRVLGMLNDPDSWWTGPIMRSECEQPADERAAEES